MFLYLNVTHKTKYSVIWPLLSINILNLLSYVRHLLHEVYCAAFWGEIKATYVKNILRIPTLLPLAGTGIRLEYRKCLLFTKKINPEVSISFVKRAIYIEVDALILNLCYTYIPHRRQKSGCNKKISKTSYYINLDKHHSRSDQKPV